MVKRFIQTTALLTLVFALGAFSAKNYDLIRVPGFIGQGASAMCTINPEKLYAVLDPSQGITVDQVSAYMSGFQPCETTNYFGSFNNADGSVVYIYRFDYSDGTQVPFVFITTDGTSIAGVQ